MPQIRLTLRPNGASCDHVIIRDTDGGILKVTTIPNLIAPINQKTDGLLIAQIKRLGRDSGLSGAQLKTFLEAQNFEF
jgi:hypothetical protein